MPVSPETRAMVLAAAEVCEDKKSTDIRILELDPLDSGLSDYFLIASGSNTRQTGAIADDIELRLKRDFGTYARSVEGRRNGEWIVLDYTDFVVHIFTSQTREFYDIERLRKSARPVDTAELAATLRPKAAAPRKAAPAKTTAGKAKQKSASTKEVSAKKAVHKKSLASEAPVKKAASAKAPPARKAAGKKTTGAPAKAAASSRSAARKAASSPKSV